MQAKVLQNAPMEHSAVNLVCIKLLNGFKIFVLSSFEWPLKKGFIVLVLKPPSTLHVGYFFMRLWTSADFYQNKLSQKVLSGTLSECQTVWIQIRTDKTSVLIWIQNCL